MGQTMTPAQLGDLLATLLEGAVGNTRQHWRDAIGPVEKLPIHLNVRCNWVVHPDGSDEDIHAIAHALELVRAEHPYVVG